MAALEKLEKQVLIARQRLAHLQQQERALSASGSEIEKAKAAILDEARDGMTARHHERFDALEQQQARLGREIAAAAVAIRDHEAEIAALNREITPLAEAQQEQQWQKRLRQLDEQIALSDGLIVAMTAELDQHQVTRGAALGAETRAPGREVGA